MLLSRNSQRRPLAQFAALLILLAVAALTLPGCGKDHDDHDGHDHAKHAANKAGDGNAHDHSDEDGHGHDDHDHDHGEEEDGHADEVKLTDEAVRRYGVQVAEAKRVVLRPTFVAPARVGLNTEAMSHVSTALTGRVSDIKVKLGSEVKRGDELLVIESPELAASQSDLLHKRTLRQTAEPAVQIAKIAWERSKALFEKSQGIALSEVERREAEYQAALATLRAAESEVVVAEQRLRLIGMKPDAIERLIKTGELSPHHSIKAEIDGVVISREVTLGERVSPDREAIMVLADTRTLWVLADVPESKQAGVKIGTPARVFLGSQTVAIADGRAPQSFEGTVTLIAPLVDPTTRTVQVRIEVPAEANRAHAMKAGMFAQAEVSLVNDGDEVAPQIAVSDAAIQTVESGPAVFVPVKGEPNTFAKRSVAVGTAVGGLVPVLSGLEEGEQYVTSGTFILKAELGKGSAAHEH